MILRFTTSFVLITAFALILQLQKVIHPKKRILIGKSNFSQAKNDRINEKSEVISTLEKAGIPLSDETYAKLPSWSDIEHLYGTAPIIHGLEQCKDFREMNTGEEVMLSIGGLFNTGTTFLQRLLTSNCQIGDVRSDVWWKHSPAEWAHKSEFAAYRTDQEIEYKVHPYKRSEYVMEDGKLHARYERFYRNMLPIISVKDPFYWFSSMCRNPYSVTWGSTDEYCPNLVPEKNTPGKGLSPEVDVYARTPKTFRHPDIESFHKHYPSLVDYWNDFNRGHLEASFPRLMVRYEDILFRTKDVVTQVCECAGGKMNEEFKYVHKAPKVGPLGTDKNGFLEAIIRYGRDDDRFEGMTEEDIKFAVDKLDLELIGKFNYHFPGRDAQ